MASLLPILIIFGICFFGLAFGMIFRGVALKGTCEATDEILSGSKEACNTCPLKKMEICKDEDETEV